MMSKPNNIKYRERIYSNYGKNFQDAPDHFDYNASLRCGKTLNYYLRGWLPECKSAQIVDLACGGGKHLHFFVCHGYKQVEGVDISPDQVALSRQIVDRVIQANVIEYLEKNTCRFDLITGFDIIEHFYKDEVMRFLNAAYYALKPGGRLILQTPNAGGPWGGYCQYDDFTHEVGFTPNSLSRLMQLIGFNNIKFRECNPMPFGYSLFSTLRALLWQLIRISLLSYNLIETGGVGNRIFTRVFLATGVRK